MRKVKLNQNLPFCQNGMGHEISVQSKVSPCPGVEGPHGHRHHGWVSRIPPDPGHSDSHQNVTDMLLASDIHFTITTCYQYINSLITLTVPTNKQKQNVTWTSVFKLWKVWRWEAKTYNFCRTTSNCIQFEEAATPLITSRFICCFNLRFGVLLLVFPWKVWSVMGVQV